jgi:uncharacterized damage-inducible protein DinB
MSDSDVTQLTTPLVEDDARPDEADGMLLRFLAYQRDSVLAIVEGLSEADWHRPVVPSGWTVAGLVEHLVGVECHWCQHVVTGVVEEPPEDEDSEPYDPEAAFVSDSPSSEILDWYRDACRKSDAVLAVTPLSAAPLGLRYHPDPEYTAEITTVRWIVHHVIEETARHAGHLDIARELLDGRTGLGPR